ncbi:MAG TPA: hypothetical protein VIM73_01735, partial [Polyangiaceae bacterium]
MIAILSVGCAQKRRPAVYPTPPPGYAGNQAPGTYPPPPATVAGPPSSPTPATPGAVPAPVLPALPPVAVDPINQIDIGFLRSRAQAVMSELVANLPAVQQARVRGIPLIVDDEVGEVNAFAACTREGKAAM